MAALNTVAPQLVLVVVVAAVLPTRRGLERTVQGGGPVADDELPGANAPVAGQDALGAVLDEYPDRLPDEQVAVLHEHVRLRPLADDRPGREDEHVVAELLDRNPEPHPLARAEPPNE